MRLLDTDTYRLCEQNEHSKRGEDPPPYAVLSHTWLPDGPEGIREVTYQDMQSSFHALQTGKFKRDGWTKLRAYCDRAAFDGWQYAWMDTCCIDKTNIRDTHEAINAMFRWYRDASICYAYLADVPEPLSVNNQWPGNNQTPAPLTRKSAFGQNYRRAMIEPQFQASNWFTRSWTLQELLAPRHLSFFDQRWRYIGSREHWQMEIARTCLISRNILTDFDPLDMRTSSIAQRLSWAAHRETTVEEDETYSLLGLFGVSMPLIYGEGRAKAFARLQLELIKTYDDNSIFAWEERVLSMNLPSNLRCHRYPTAVAGTLPILSPSIKNFANAMNVTNFDEFNLAEFSMTNRGLSVETRLWSFTSPDRMVNTIIMPIGCVEQVIPPNENVAASRLIGVSLGMKGTYYYRNKMGLVYIDRACVRGAAIRVSRQYMVSSGMTRDERKEVQGFLYKKPSSSSGLLQAPFDFGCSNSSKFIIMSTHRWRGAEGWFVHPTIGVFIPANIGTISMIYIVVLNSDGSLPREDALTCASADAIVLAPSEVAIILIRLAKPINQMLVISLRMTDHFTTVVSSELLDRGIDFDLKDNEHLYLPGKHNHVMVGSQKTPGCTVFIALRPCPPVGTNPVVGEWDVKPDPLREYRLEVYT